jgi:hypothetical protein
MVGSLDWVCHRLWSRSGGEPELLQLQSKRGSIGFPHYIVSRVGMLPASDWAPALYVLPPSLVAHLQPKCMALDPPDYLLAALEAGGSALRRLRPGAQERGLVELALTAHFDGELPRAWAALLRTGDPHRDLLWAAMTVREARAHAHYQAAFAAELGPLPLLLLTGAWKGENLAKVETLFRWSDAEIEAGLAALRESGWLGEGQGLTGSGRALREEIEARTEAHTRQLLSELSDKRLEQLVEELPAPA